VPHCLPPSHPLILTTVVLATRLILPSHHCHITAISPSRRPHAAMASLPPQRPASHRRASPPAEPSSPQQEPHARTNSFSAQSVDSQTLFLNSPLPAHAPPPAHDQHAAAAQQTAAPSVEEDDIKRCWICFNDETEDDESSSEWRSPCSCSLVAHEMCLLDWIADMEAPNSRRKAGKRAAKVLSAVQERDCHCPAKKFCRRGCARRGALYKLAVSPGLCLGHRNRPVLDVDAVGNTHNISDIRHSRRAADSEAVISDAKSQH